MESQTNGMIISGSDLTVVLILLDTGFYMYAG